MKFFGSPSRIESRRLTTAVGDIALEVIASKTLRRWNLPRDGVWLHLRNRYRRLALLRRERDLVLKDVAKSLDTGVVGLIQSVTSTRAHLVCSALFLCILEGPVCR